MNKIKIKDIEISAEELRRIVKENEALLKEPEVKGRYFFPERGEEYWNYNSVAVSLFRHYFCGIDLHNVSIGNCFRTEEEAKLALDKQKAIVACWKWQQENAPFEPDWGNMGQKKFCVIYDHISKKFNYDCCTNIQTQFILPHLKSKEDKDNFIEACKEHLTLLFTK